MSGGPPDFNGESTPGFLFRPVGSPPGALAVLDGVWFEFVRHENPLNDCEKFEVLNGLPLQESELGSVFPLRWRPMKDVEEGIADF